MLWGRKANLALKNAFPFQSKNQISCQKIGYNIFRMQLFGSRFKNDDEQFLKMKDFYTAIGKLLEKDEFISRKHYSFLVNDAKETYDTFTILKSTGTLGHWCKEKKCSQKDLETYLFAYQNVSDSIEKHNDMFVNRHLKVDKEYLDGILALDDPKILLDEDQRKVVLNDEDYTLVIAGAGAGKTTTLEAKAKYLVEKKKVRPERILIVSFTKKATQELKDRFKKIGIPAVIATFHSIGNTIIKGAEGKHSVKGPGFMFDTLRNYLISKLEDEGFIKKIMLFFASYLDIPFNSHKSLEIYKRVLADSDFTTLRSDLDDFKENLTKKKITIRSERVRSIQECQIANFFFINGIDYEYEPIYPYCIPGTSKPYTPDFRIWQGNREAYLEHFGIDENGNNWRFSPQELADYRKHIKDKGILHRKHGTTLLSTYSAYNDGRSLISHLKDVLLKNGFTLNAKEDKAIYKEIAQRAEDRYFTKLIQLLCTFINRFKTNNYKFEKFTEFMSIARENKDERTYLFLEIAQQCYRNYSNALAENNAIDFEDMINNAADILDEKIRRNEKLPYDYIFIDEYQDISTQRFNLAEKLSKCSNAKIVAVGDDWQSIFRFSGADITLFTDFEKKMGYGKILYLRNTHRNSQELIDIAGSFIMKNELQKKKSLFSATHLEDPVIIMSYDDSYASKKDISLDKTISPYYRMGKAIERALEDIRSHFKDSDVLLLGRYNFDGRNLNQLSDMFLCTSDNRVRSKRFPDMHIRFMTAHASKGLGAGNVIVINGKDDVLGFPSKIEDDPVMKLVLKDAKEIEYAEERRLFYVALTRTRNRVYIITPKNKPSQFIQELKEGHTNIVLNGPELSGRTMNDFRYKCPYCGYPLQVKKRKMRGKDELMTTLYVCSNDPEVCGFVTNDLSGGKMYIQKCPDCEDGYLIVKKIKEKGKDTGRRILGCTNYKADDTGCNYIIDQDHFAETWERTARTKANYSQRGKKLPLERCVLAGYPIMDFLKIIKYVTSKLSQSRRFTFSKSILVKFLIGSKEKSFEKYSLDQDRCFGCCRPDTEKLLYSLMDVLVEYGALQQKSNGRYPYLDYTGKDLTEELARNIFERYVFE